MPTGNVNRTYILAMLILGRWIGQGMNKFLQKSQENAWVSLFLIKLHLFNKIKIAILLKETVAQVFSCEFCKFLRTPFYTEHLWWLLLIGCKRKITHCPDSQTLSEYIPTIILDDNENLSIKEMLMF